MDLDNLKFENDEQRRQYLSDLARLKKYQQDAQKNEKEVYKEEFHGNFSFYDIPDDNHFSIDEEDIVPEKNRKKKFPVVLIVILALLIGICGFFAYKVFLAPTANPGYYTVAVFGLDARDGNMGKGALSDVNMIVQVNQKTGEIKLVSIYRDTYVQINPDNTYHKFNEAYFRGGVEQALWALETNLDIKVDDYAVFNWSSVANAINILGGIDLEISDAEFAYINGFITETVESTGIYSTHLEHAGINHLDGVQAVAYARLRLMDTDYQRTQRQRIVVELCLNKAKQSGIKTLITLAQTILPQIKTSIDISKAAPFLFRYKQLHIGETTGFPFDKVSADVKDRRYAVVALTLESNVIKLHEFLYPGEQYTPSSDVKRISNHIIDVSGLK